MADIGVFINLRQDDPDAMRRKQILDGGLPNYHIDYRYGGGDYNSYGNKAIDLIRSNPDARLFVASCWPTVRALIDAMQAPAITPPKGVVYVGVTYDVSSPGYNSTSSPTYGGDYPPNVTGIKAFELPGLCPNWPSLLMQIAPNVKRMAVIYDFDSSRSSMGDQNRMMTASATSLGLSVAQPIDAGLSSTALKAAIDGFASADTSPAGLIVTAGTLSAGNRRDIFAAGNNLPVIYPSNLYTDSRNCPEAAGLISYGPDVLGLYDRAISGFLRPILSQSGTTADIRTRFPPLSNMNFDLIVNLSAIQKLAANGVQLNVPDTMTVTLNGMMTQVQVTKV